MSNTTGTWFLDDDSRAEWPDGDALTGEILDAISDVLYVVDRRGRFVDWNERFPEVTGYSDAEIAELHEFAIIPDEYEPAARELLAAVADGEEVTFEAPLLTKDGERIPHEFTASPLSDEDGAVWGMVGTARDVSELLETEARLRERERRFSTLVANLPGMAYRCRNEQGWPMEFVSEGCAALTGYDPDALEAGEISWGEDVLHPEDRERMWETVQTAVDGGDPFTVTYRIRRKDGTERWVWEQGRCVDGPDGSVEFLEGFITDVTERKRREQDLERYERLIETVGDGVYVLDGNREVVQVNDALTEMLGYDREDLLGMPVTELVPTADARGGARLRQQLRESDTTVATIEGELVRQDGTTVPVEERFSLLSSDGGVTIGLVRDISDRTERAALFERLHEGIRDLMDAETVTEVAATAAGVIGRHFDHATTGVRLLRDDELEMVAAETDGARLDEPVPPCPVGAGLVGEAYERGEPVVVDDLRDAETTFEHESVRSALLLPIEGYGMVHILATEPGAFDETDLELGRLFVADVRAAFERADREEQLRERTHELGKYETLVETMSDGVYMTDDDHRITMVNDAAVELVGKSREALVGEPVDEVGYLDADEAQRNRRTVVESDASVGTVEDVVERADGRERYVENRFSLLPSDDGFSGTVGVVRDITDRKEREDLIRRLHEVSQELMAAETKRAVAERTAAAAERLGFPTVAVRLLDETGDRLDAVARETNDDRVRDVPLPSYAVGAGLVGEAYERGEPLVVDDLRAADLPADPGPVRSALLLPIEGHGVVSIAATEPAAFDETDLELGRLFAAVVEAAFQRADREEKLRDRKERLKAQRDELETLNRINELVQETIGSLASAPTREDIEAAVCERLGGSSLYRFAFTGTEPPDDKYVEPRAWAGDGAEYLSAVEIPADADVDGAGPTARTLETGEMTVTHDVESDPLFESFREAALEFGFRSVAVVPLAHGDVDHDVLVVYADRTGAFSERELQALEVLGEMVGFAISATQNRRLIESDSHLELTLDVADAETLGADLSRQTGCTVRLLGSVEASDNEVLHYASVAGADPSELVAVATESEYAPSEVRLVRGDDERGVLEFRFDDSIPSRLIDSGVRPVEVVAADGDVHVVAEAPPSADVRTLIDRLGAYGDVSLVSKRDVDRWETPAESLRERLRAELTDRQQTVLNAAYYGGYFDWPRDSTAEEVAASLDIASATLHQHLRHAQRKLLAAYLDDDSSRT